MLRKEYFFELCLSSVGLNKSHRLYDPRLTWCAPSEEIRNVKCYSRTIKEVVQLNKIVYEVALQPAASCYCGECFFDFETGPDGPE